jgi:hypothetical protein
MRIGLTKKIGLSDSLRAKVYEVFEGNIPILELIIDCFEKASQLPLQYNGIIPELLSSFTFETTGIKRKMVDMDQFIMNKIIEKLKDLLQKEEEEKEAEKNKRKRRRIGGKKTTRTNNNKRTNRTKKYKNKNKNKKTR